MSKKSKKDHLNAAQLGNRGTGSSDDNGAVSTRILQEIYSQRTDIVLFLMTNIRDIQNNWKKINADYNCLFLSRAHDRNKGKTQKSPKD